MHVVRVHCVPQTMVTMCLRSHRNLTVWVCVTSSNSLRCFICDFDSCGRFAFEIVGRFDLIVGHLLNNCVLSFKVCWKCVQYLRPYEMNISSRKFISLIAMTSQR